MTAEPEPIDVAKFVAAKRAVAFVEDGMKVGLGTGSTSAWMVRCLAERVRDEGLNIRCAATSGHTARLAAGLGLHVGTLADLRWLDVTIDGADEFDPDLNLIKGGGAALLHEKIVAAASDQMIVIADPSKEVAALGAFPLPVEVIPFGWRTTATLVEEALGAMNMLGQKVERRMRDKEAVLTDESNYILDLHLGRIEDPRRLALALNQVPGVVENGLFIDMCDVVIVGRPDGVISIRNAIGGKVSDEKMTLAPSDNIFTGL